MKPKIIGKLRNNKWYQMEKIDFKTLLAIFLIIIIFFGLQQFFGGNIFDFFSVWRKRRREKTRDIQDCRVPGL